MRAVTGVWRWRHNPLRRATDRREAWVALVALFLMVLAAPALGWVCGAHTDDALQKSVRAQRAGRHATTAVVVRRSPRAPRVVADPEISSERGSQTSVVARWKAPDGTNRRGTVTTSSRKTGPGAEVEIWTDLDGHPVSRPMDAPTARTHAVLAGFGAMLLTLGLIEGVRQLIVRHMVRGRYTRIDRDWAETGPDWGRTGTGS
ncbi:hypothetical protein [Streptomyces sp. NBC_01363]|uniref:Rv1733c family protein n=1 Tax=Streptomyces sp. NBC_01363 TaxID=2903840 RepID=UPI0022561471|nr:hypothetical protein [Streptomyces sp. NBC_01363]MCX4733855.1 hypothetical protein [Streptomyces sp. NBC_01363]